ncbi:hypothetical protein GS467_13940 [Rhodococcus hoagii]|nr:hypothetical protein [Prescottella equi]
MRLGEAAIDVVFSAGDRISTGVSTAFKTMIVLGAGSVGGAFLVTRLSRAFDGRLAWRPRLKAAKVACYSASVIAFTLLVGLGWWGDAPISLVLTVLWAFILLVPTGLSIGRITAAIGRRVGQSGDGLTLSSAVRRAALAGLNRAKEAWDAAWAVGSGLSEPSWYGPRGGRWLMGGGCFAVLLGGVSVELMISRGVVSDMMRQYAVLYGLTILFSVTIPAVLAWVLIGALHGRPRIRASVARLAGCSGGGATIGFLVATAGFFWHRYSQQSATNEMSLGSEAADSAFTVATFVNVSTLGAVVGYALGLVLVVHDSGQTLPNRLLGWIGVPVCIGVVGASVLALVPPASVLDGLVDGFAASTPEPSEWQRALLADRGWLVGSAPTPGIVVIVMVLASTIVSVASWYSWNRRRGKENAECSRSPANGVRPACQQLQR